MGAALLAVSGVVQGTVGGALQLLVLTALLVAAVYAVVLHRKRSAPAEGDAEASKQALVFKAVEQSPESLALVDYQGRLLYANQTFLARTGYTLQEVVGKPARVISANGMNPEQHQQMRSEVEQGHVWRSVLVNRRKDGSEIHEGISIGPVTDDQGHIACFVEFKQDVTELLLARERLTQLMHIDPVTLLPNRWALSQRLEDLIRQSPAFPLEPLHWHALLLLDIDHFTVFNAARGMEWGDDLLAHVARQMQVLLPDSAWSARTAGDEFAVILENVAQTRIEARLSAYALAIELQRGLSVQMQVGDNPETVTISFGIGITVFPFVEPSRKRDSEGHIYRRASMALYQAKALGTGQVHTFSEALEQSTQRRLAVEHGLHEALAQGQLRLYLQNQVDINGQVHGVEALVRWQPPDQELVSPGVFIPVAEESDLIVQIGDWVLQQVVDLLDQPLVRNTQLSVAVNISARQFAQPDFVNKVWDLMCSKNIGPGRLTLEVTESMVLANVDDAVQKMTRLHGLGVYCSLDDFGTGYSSLAYLHKLPIQEIKIDQSFIHDLQHDAKSCALVQALLMVAQSMQLRVVAEGVKDEDQAALLRAWFPAILCQGYLYSRPIPAQEWLQTLSVQPPTAP